MGRYIVRRLLQFIPTVLGTLFLLHRKASIPPSRSAATRSHVGSSADTSASASLLLGSRARAELRGGSRARPSHRDRDPEADPGAPSGQVERARVEAGDQRVEAVGRHWPGAVGAGAHSQTLARCEARWWPLVDAAFWSARSCSRPTAWRARQRARAGRPEERGCCCSRAPSARATPVRSWAPRSTSRSRDLDAAAAGSRQGELRARRAGRVGPRRPPREPAAGRPSASRVTTARHSSGPRPRPCRGPPGRPCPRASGSRSEACSRSTEPIIAVGYPRRSAL